MKTKKNLKKGVVAAGLLGCMITVGISAYFTDMDKKQDTYTIGSVEIQNNFKENEIPVADLLPLDTVSYEDVTVQNIGKSDAYVFMTVDIPVAEVYTHEADGTPVNKASKELLTMAGKASDTVWKQVSRTEIDTDADEVNDTARYVFAYVADSSLATLAPGATPDKGKKTPALFSGLQYINVSDVDLEGNPVAPAVEGETLDVHVNAYGIQAKGLGTTDPAGVWAIVENAVGTSAEG